MEVHRSICRNYSHPPQILRELCNPKIVSCQKDTKYSYIKFEQITFILYIISLSRRVIIDNKYTKFSARRKNVCVFVFLCAIASDSRGSS